MNELFTRAERTALSPLYPFARDALLLSGLQGHLGRAFLSDHGQSALVLVQGFIFLGGKADEKFFHQVSGILPACFLTFSGDEAWRNIAKSWGANTEMTRYSLETPNHFDDEMLRRLAVPPPGYTLMPADESLYHQCLQERWSEDLVASYQDYAAFDRHALAILALRDGRLAAGCGVYAHTDSMWEIEIDTHPDFRRQGLAAACGAKFLLECQKRGMQPHWDAMTNISAALAQKLGFQNPRPYQVVCREAE